MTINRRRVMGSMAAALGWGGLSDGFEAHAQQRKKAARATGKAARKGAGGLHHFNQVFGEILDGAQIVGGTLAIAKEGRLILAGGHGFADVDAEKPVKPTTLFCIGSITKAMTAVAILRLVDMGKLHLDARLVDVVKDLVEPPDGGFADPRFGDITVRHVLYHASGIPDRIDLHEKHHKKAGHKAVDSDPDRTNPKAKHHKKAVDNDENTDADESSGKPLEMLRAAMSLPLDFAPGSNSKYSNSGYLVARTILEARSGQEYVPFVTEQVFRPMGISTAVMERQEPLPNETCRYRIGPKGRHSPARNPVNWLFTASEMVKFLTSVAGIRGEPFLSKKMLHAMTAKPKPPIPSESGEHHVGLGWDAVTNTPDGPGFAKAGGKPGVAAWAQHRPDGVSWAFMINTNGDNKDDGTNPMDAIKKRINEELDRQAAWPSIDLFEA